MATVPGTQTFPAGDLFPSSDAGPTTGAWIFRTPYVQRRVPVFPPVVALMNFSLAVLRIQGQWVETEWPTEEQIEAADLYFPGGYENVVDDAVAQILQAAGYEVATVIDDAPPVVLPGPGKVGTAVVGLAITG